MKKLPRIARIAAVLALAATLLPAQSRPVASPAPAPSALVALPGNVPAFAQPRFDRGPVPDSFAADRILLLLRRSPQQQAALDKFLQDAATPGNPQYHHWLTPAQFGEQFGPAQADLARVRAWLQQQGFTVSGVNQGRTAIEFSATAGQIRHAFHTEIHTYAVGSQTLHANSSDPKIPASLAPLIQGLTPLTDVHPHPDVVVRGREQSDTRTLAADPQWTAGCSGYNCRFPQLLLSPADFAVQYDLNPLYQAGVNGSGTTIGVIGAANIVPADVANYRSFFSLPPLTVNQIVDGNDPGPYGAVVESELDVEISGSVAPHAAIDLYTAADTSLQSGLALAAQRAVDEDQADVLSVSYGECEQDLGASGNVFWNSLWEQAAAQGQTVLVSSGDQGAATCDANDPIVYPNPPPLAQHGLTVNGIASTPWNLAVGGTDFYYNPPTATQAGTYWNVTPTAQPSASLLQTVPEQPWNRPFGVQLDFLTPAGQNSILAAGGGVSNCTAGTAASDGTIASCSGGYAKPSWQTGAGVPSDSARDLPDLSLFAAAGENDSAYPLCTVYANCTQVPNIGLVITEAGGTSASVQAMAGVMSLIVQKYGRQGQAAYVLYPLAAQHPEAFHDVTAGSNKVPCVQGSADCSQSTSNDGTSGDYVIGYDAAPGYDLATGLGSVDVNRLVTDWSDVHFTPTTTTLSLSQTTFAHGTPITAQVTVSGNGGTPTGQVALVTTASPSNAGLGTLTLSGGSASASLSTLPGGKYTVTARYGGDGTFAASESAPVTVNVSPEPSAIAISGHAWTFTEKGWVNGWQPIPPGGSYEYGDSVAIDAQITGAAGPDGKPTGTVTFSTGTLTSGPLPVNSEGVAEWRPPKGLPAGSYSVTASYSGDASFNASTAAAPFNFTVAKNTPFAGGDEGCGPSTVVYGTPVCLQSGLHVMLDQSEAVPPTGTLTFLFGQTNLGSGALLCCDPPPPYPVPYLYLSNKALQTADPLPLGTDTITVQYSGDGNYNPLSFPMTVKVTPPVTMTVSADPPVIADGQKFTVTATLTGTAGQPTPTGNVSFSIMDWSYGGQLATGSANLTNGTASYTFSLNLTPQYGSSLTVDANYQGDALYGPASARTTLSISAPFAVSGSNVTTAPAATAQSTITVTPSGGFTGNVALRCALTSSPAGEAPPTCALTPASVSITGPAATATMSIAAAATTSARAQSWLLPGGAGLLAFAAFLGIPARRRRWWDALFCLLLATALSVGLTACGTSLPHSSAPQAGQLAPGSYVFTVTGASQMATGQTPVTAQTQVTITVQ